MADGCSLIPRSDVGQLRVVRCQPKWTACFALCIVLLAVSSSATPHAKGQSNELEPCSPPVRGQLADLDVTESSGVSASVDQPGVFWTINDSGSIPKLHAFDLEGTALGSWLLPTAENVDWEDLALIASGTVGSTLVVGDIGDNLGVRDHVSLYYVPEPDIDVDGDVSTRTAEAKRVDYIYPTGPVDAEALLIDPRTGETVIISKEPGIARLFLASSDGNAGNLVEIGSVPLPGISPLQQVTGAAISADGSTIALRTVQSIFIWDASTSTSIAQVLLTEPAQMLVPFIGQSEAVTFSADGSALIFTAEGVPAPLMRVSLDWLRARNSPSTDTRCEGLHGPTGSS